MSVTGYVYGCLWVSDLRCLPKRQPDDDGYVVAAVGSGSVVRCFTRGAKMTEDAYDARLAAGHRAYAAWHQESGDLAGSLWTTTGPAYHPPIDRTSYFGPGECGSFGAEVPEKRHRGHHLMTRMLVYAGETMAHQGYRWMWGGILDVNEASRASCIACGWRPILHVRYQSQTGRLRTWPADYAPELLVTRARAGLASPAQVAVAS